MQQTPATGLGRILQTVVERPSTCLRLWRRQQRLENDALVRRKTPRQKEMTLIAFSPLSFRDMFEDRKIWVPDTFLPGDTEGFLNDVQASTGGRSFSKVQCCGGVLASMK